MQYPLARDILRSFSGRGIPAIPIQRYMDVFGRSHQRFSFQKNSPAVILAVKHGNFVYPGAPVCQDFGNAHFYYTSFALNCPFDCEYCYLQGMYSCAHIVLFVNLEDYFAEIRRLLSEHPVYLCISYDTDLLALEKMTGFLSGYTKFAAKQPQLTTELRTKSASYLSADSAQTANLLSPEVRSRIIHAYTLSPDFVIAKFEHHTPALSARLKAIRSAALEGYPVRLCFDPLIYIPDFEQVYSDFLDTVRTGLDGVPIKDASVGVFRIADSYLKQMRKSRPDSALLQFPFENTAHVCHYGPRSHEMIQFVLRKLDGWLSPNQIFTMNLQEVSP